MRNHVTRTAVVFLVVFGSARAQDTKYAPKGQQILGPECLTIKGAWEGGSLPCTVNEREKWLADITHWRFERRIRIGYEGSRYERPEFKWTQSSFIQPQMMIEAKGFGALFASKTSPDNSLQALMTK